MLDVYADVVENVLAVPVVKGKKSAIERFAGATSTYTIEALMPNGWALQSGTSHFLGAEFRAGVRRLLSDQGGEEGPGLGDVVGRVY